VTGLSIVEDRHGVSILVDPAHRARHEIPRRSSWRSALR